MIKVYQTKVNLNMNEEDSMKYVQILLGLYTPATEELPDIYEQTCEFDYSINVKSIDTLLETVMRYLNMDDRPNGKYHKSLSVGDVVCVDEACYICRSLGFEKVNWDMSSVEESDWILRELF